MVRHFYGLHGFQVLVMLSEERGGSSAFAVETSCALFFSVLVSPRKCPSLRYSLLSLEERSDVATGCPACITRNLLHASSNSSIFFAKQNRTNVSPPLFMNASPGTVATPAVCNKCIARSLLSFPGNEDASART